MDPRFAHDQFTVRRKVLKLFGGTFHVFDPNGNVVLYAKQKAFKLKEDIRLFASEGMQEELLRISARNVIDFSGVYDVVDAKTGEPLGNLRRAGMKSLLKDEWTMNDRNDQPIGKIHEENMTLALLRRFLTNLIPQTYHVYNNNGEVIAAFHRNFNPFVSKVTVDFTHGAPEVMDKRFGLAAAILLVAIEGKQASY